MGTLRQIWNSPMVMASCQENVSKVNYQKSNALQAFLVQDGIPSKNSPKVVCYKTKGLVWLKVARECAKE